METQKTYYCRTAEDGKLPNGEPNIIEWEIPILYTIEEVYHGNEEPDDPSHCIISELVEVLEDTGPFKKGDQIVLDDDFRHGLEEEELNEARSGSM